MGRYKNEAADIISGITLPKAVYFQCIWIIKDIDRLRMLEALHNYKERPDEMLCCGMKEDSMVTENVIEEGVRKLRAIRAAILPVPEDMRQDLIESIMAGTGFGDYAHENTWKKWKKRFINELAHNLDLV